jgi:NAD(P)-dependent dehydrogenase (short-subunit alcohol dehydrogenase family)
MLYGCASMRHHQMRESHIMQKRFDLNSTADDVLAEIDLSGRLAVVSGGAAGLGKETAQALAARGADVIIGGRDLNLLKATAEEISSSGNTLAHALDLLPLPSVRDFAAAVMSANRAVDLLILNAGIMACPRARSPEGIESQLATNFIGHACLASALVPALLKSAEPRLISQSSTAHQMSPVVFSDVNYERRGYDPWEAYAQSKTATALLAVKVSQELLASGITAHALHPGGVMTGLLKHMSANVAAELANRYKFDTSKVKVKTLAEGAATTAWAATEPSLLRQPTLYLEDCRVAEVIDTPVYTRGVMRYAMNPDIASQLWRAAEKMIGAALPLAPR